MRLSWGILLVSVMSLVLVCAGALIGGYVGDATCTPSTDDDFIPCMNDFTTGLFVGGLLGVGAAVVLGHYLWARTRSS